MVDILKKKKYKRVLYSWPVILILLVLLVLVGRASWNMYEQYRKTQDKLAAVQAEYQQLKKRYEDMQSDVTQLKSKEGVQQVMRQRFGVAKKNEEVVFIVDRKKEDGEEEKDDTRSWWETVRGFFSL